MCKLLAKASKVVKVLLGSWFLVLGSWFLVLGSWLALLAMVSSENSNSNLSIGG
ncbi:hypothetical protein NMR91_004686 [Vibrio alginolyticus]|nr:hypothetical protein [Vibrio alginolyticus]